MRFHNEISLQKSIASLWGDLDDWIRECPGMPMSLRLLPPSPIRLSWEGRITQAGKPLLYRVSISFCLGPKASVRYVSIAFCFKAKCFQSMSWFHDTKLVIYQDVHVFDGKKHTSMRLHVIKHIKTHWQHIKHSTLLISDFRVHVASISRSPSGWTAEGGSPRFGYHWSSVVFVCVYLQSISFIVSCVLRCSSAWEKPNCQIN